MCSLVVACSSNSFSFLSEQCFIVQICCNQFIHSPVDWHLGYFQLGAFTNKAAMNIGVEVLVWTHIFISFEEISGSIMVAFYGEWHVLIFLRNYQVNFRASCTLFHSHQQYTSIPISPQPHQPFGMFILFNFSQSNGCIVRYLFGPFPHH